MADNITVLDSTGATKTVASDDVSGVMHQRIKLTFGPDGSSADASLTNPLPVVFSAPGTTYTDRSGTITTGGAAQTLAALNTARRGYRVVNLSNADLWLNDKGSSATASQPSLKIVSGGAYESPAFGCSTTAISIYGATTGQAFEAAEC